MNAGVDGVIVPLLSPASLVTVVVVVVVVVVVIALVVVVVVEVPVGTASPADLSKSFALSSFTTRPLCTC